VDGHDIDDPKVRIDAIAASAKPVCLVIDFVGNSGKHKLMTSADILGGKLSDEVLERANKKAKDGQVRMDQALIEAEKEEAEEIERRRLEAEEAQRRLEARRGHLKAKATFSVRTINPFDVLDIQPARARGWDEGKVLTQKQMDFLLRQKIDPSEMTYSQAKQTLNTLFYRLHNNLATLKQVSLLKSRGINGVNLTMEQATVEIKKIALAEGWR